MKPSDVDLMKSWNAIYKNSKQADAKLLELIAHPEATDAMILEACHARRESTIKSRETYRKALEACIKKGWRRAEWFINERSV